jgi:prophage DNA circulation protein
MTSPSGLEFSPKFVGSPRSVSKKVGIFSYPGVMGDVVQDLDTNSVIYPLTFFFDGQNHDLESDRLFQACKERGRWEIIHPVHGFKELQLLTVEEDVQPIESGNVTQFTSEWIESIDPATLQTTAELRGLVGQQADITNITAADQFVRASRSASAADQFSVTRALENATTTINQALTPLAEQNAEIAANQLAITRGIQDLLAAAVFKPLAIAAQMQNLVQNPLRAVTDIGNRLSTYAALAQSLLGIDTEGTSGGARNRAAVKELTLTSVVTANALIATSGPARPESATDGDLRTRAQAVEFANTLADTLSTMINSLDEAQEGFATQSIEDQYFSQGQTYPETLRITALATNYLLTAAFDLAVEKRFTLDIPKHPVRVTVEQYGTLGDNDANLIRLINANKLKGIEIVLLPAGKELVVYV